VSTFESLRVLSSCAVLAPLRGNKWQISAISSLSLCPAKGLLNRHIVAMSYLWFEGPPSPLPDIRLQGPRSFIAILGAARSQSNVMRPCWQGRRCLERIAPDWNREAIQGCPESARENNRERVHPDRTRITFSCSN
jgi:hypothetical protein